MATLGVKPRVIIRLLLEEVRGCCQTDANQSRFRQVRRLSVRAEVAPLGKSGVTVHLVDVAA